MGIIQDTISAKKTTDFDPVETELTEEKINEVLDLMNNGVTGNYGLLSTIALVTGVSEDNIKEIFEERDTKLKS